jgi:hypothetical protein
MAKKELIPNSQNTMTIYSEGGNVLGIIPLIISGLSTRTRCMIIHDYGFKKWHHYSFHNTKMAFLKGDFLNAYLMDLETGKIIEQPEYWRIK